MPSNEVRPTAGLTARFMAPTPPEKVPAVRLKRTPVVCSGSMISMSQPVLPFSSPTMMVPHGVRLEGSHEMVPVRIVSTVPSSRRTRWTPGWAAPSSLQKMRWVGEELSGQSAIMSTLGAEVRRRGHHVCAQATRQRDQRGGIPVGLGGGDAFPRRGCERSVDAEELLGAVVQQPFPEQQLLHGDPPDR